MASDLQVQSQSAEFATSAAARTITLPINTTAGNFIAIGVTSFNDVTVTVADELAHSYLRAGGYAGTGDKASIWYDFNITSAARTITVTPSGSAALTLCVAEFSGLITTDPIDGSAGASGSSTAPATGSITVGATGELILGQLTTSANNVANAPQNCAIACHRFSSANQPGGLLVAMRDAATNLSVTLSSSTSWAFAGASFKVVAAGGSGGGTLARLPAGVSGVG